MTVEELFAVLGLLLFAAFMLAINLRTGAAAPVLKRMSYFLLCVCIAAAAIQLAVALLL